jgi:2-polyprenyl-3-methyl-5-hydroxy-6-metoxy-1,4-benzoquinol methylase
MTADAARLKARATIGPEHRASSHSVSGMRGCNMEQKVCMMAAVTAHNQLPYINSPYAQTHPSRLFVMARLAGLEAPAVEKCRVLEMGASEGENLIGMAMVLPAAEFVGIELAELPVERGRKTIDDLGLVNVRLEQMNILDVDEGLGQFDYIIAHGVYSWTPAAVRDKVLAIVETNLHPKGVAYVSYNTFPGRHVHQMLREMMLYHIGEETDPAIRLKRARDLLRMIAMGRPEVDSLEGAVAAHAAELLARTDSALYHDDLCESYQPVYFHEFAAHAAGHGLQYLGEADPQESLKRNLKAEALAWVREEADGDRMAEQQYLDFARTQKFRQTLLCHAENVLGEGTAEGCYAAAMAQETEEGVFLSASGTRMTTKHPAPVEYLRRLIALAPGSAQITSEESDLAVQLYRAGMIYIRAFPGVARRAGERPCASAFARYQAARGDARVTTLGHRTMALVDEEARKLIGLLDGRRDRAELAMEMECSGEMLDAALELLAKNEVLTE